MCRQALATNCCLTTCLVHAEAHIEQFRARAAPWLALLIWHCGQCIVNAAAGLCNFKLCVLRERGCTARFLAGSNALHAFLLSAVATGCMSCVLLALQTRPTQRETSPNGGPALVRLLARVDSPETCFGEAAQPGNAALETRGLQLEAPSPLSRLFTPPGLQAKALAAPDPAQLALRAAGGRSHHGIGLSTNLRVACQACGTGRTLASAVAPQRQQMAMAFLQMSALPIRAARCVLQPLIAVFAERIHAALTCDH